jgi:hypothetical protein
LKRFISRAEFDIEAEVTPSVPESPSVDKGKRAGVNCFCFLI